MTLSAKPSVGNYRSTDAVELWSSRLSGNFTRPELEHAIKVAVVNDRQHYTGFVSAPTNGHEISYTRTRYPRKKYGITPIVDCELGMAKLADMVNGEIQSEKQVSGFRVVLGLIEGYDKEAPKHTISEIVAKLGEGALIESADVLAIRFAQDRISTYTEPVVVIRGSQSELPRIYELADEFKQERFTVEDFDAQKAWVIETRFCTEPD